MRAVAATSPPNFVQGAGFFILIFDECSIEEVGVCTLEFESCWREPLLKSICKLNFI